MSWLAVIVRRRLAPPSCIALALATSALLSLAGCGEGSTPPAGDGGLRVDAGEPPTDAPPDDDGASAVDAPPVEPDAGPARCPPTPACDAPPPPLGATSAWRHSITTPIVIAMGGARHRGRDLYLRETDPQWALAKFAYGPLDDDLKDEDVEVWLNRDCGAGWELLGVARTTDDGAHATVEGVEDTGGRVFFPIPDGARLGLGRHRILFAVRGDHTTAEQFIEVLPPTARFVVTDVDGTQTESETAEWATLLTGTGPAAQPSGAALLAAYAERGYRIFFLTARPEWLGARTHAWLREYGYPEGNVHTTLTGTGALGSAAATFKTDELSALLARFPGSIELGVGNTDTDAAAYAAVGLPPERVVSYRFDAGAIATRVDDYGALVPAAERAPLACP